MPTVAPTAPDLDAIFDVEGGVEPVFVKALIAAGICDVDPERSPEEIATPRAEVQIHLGTCLRRREPAVGVRDPRAGLPCEWKCTVMVTVATDRANPRQVEAHSRYRAKARRVAALFLTSLNPRLAFHRIEELNETGTTTGLINPQATTEDISRMEFAGVVSVRHTAWPAGT